MSPYTFWFRISQTHIKLAKSCYSFQFWKESKARTSITKKTPEAWKLDADRGNASSSTVHYLSFALTSCSKSVSVGFFQTLLSSNVVRNLCISACTYFGSAAQTRLFFWWLHAIPGKCSTTDSFRVCYFCSPTSPQALHPWLPWHGPPDTAGWEWPPGIALARWDSSAWTRLSWSPGSDHPSDWTRSSPRAPPRRPGRDSGGMNTDITCETLSVIGQAPATWLATSLNRAEAIQPRRGSTTATCQVFIYMSDATTRAGNQNSVPLPPSSFTAPPCLCPCHFTVGHAAFFFRVTGQRQWRLENTRNFLLLGRKKMLTTGCHRMRNGASVVERKSLWDPAKGSLRN